jgi:hypothetical protein
MHINRFLSRALAGTALLTAAFGVQVALTAGPSAPSSTVTIDPVRILDTRAPIGVPTIARVPAGGSISVLVAGANGVPAGATGVIVTVTGTGATVPTFVTATPTGSPRSTTSVLNVTPGQDIANTITIAIGAGGMIDLFNNAGSIDLIADVSGYLLPPTAHVETTTIDLGAYAAALRSGAVAIQNDGCINLGTTGELALDINLPYGAAIQKIDFRYFDTATAAITFVLFEVDTLASGIPTVAGTLSDSQVASSGQAGYGKVTMTPTGADAVSDSVRYYVDLFTPGVGAGTAHWYCGANVTYQRIVT